MRKRILLNNRGGGWGTVDGSKATPMSVVFADKETGNLEIVEGDGWSAESHPASKYEPIGIVVIPGEHGVLKDGSGTVNQCGVMSLVSMWYSTPEKGGTGIIYGIYWGGYGTNINGMSDGLGRYDSVTNGLTNYNVVNQVGSNGNVYETLQGTADYALLPSDAVSTVKNPYDNGTSYIFNDDDYCYAPSPYKNDGSFNPIYSQTTSSGSTANTLSDFNGIVNTKILTDLAVKQSNWKTASAITNSSNSGFYPSACCCARFKTTGTKAFVDCSIEELRNGTGFWYLPSCGELGHVAVRQKAIENMISKLKSAYGGGVGDWINGNSYWSSSEYSGDNARYVHMTGGYVNHYSKNYGNKVKAFMRL